MATQYTRTRSRGWESDAMVVAKSGGQYSTIQSAIDAASAGDAVIVGIGTFNEQITMKDDVDVIGVDPRLSIISYLPDDNEGPTVTGASNCRLANLGIVFKDPLPTGLAGGVLDASFCAILVSNETNFRVECCDIAGGHWAIKAMGCTYVHMRQCRIASPQPFYMGDSADSSMTYCDCTYTGYAAKCQGFADLIGCDDILVGWNRGLFDYTSTEVGQECYGIRAAGKRNRIIGNHIHITTDISPKWCFQINAGRDVDCHGAGDAVHLLNNYCKIHSTVGAGSVAADYDLVNYAEGTYYVPPDLLMGGNIMEMTFANGTPTLYSLGGVADWADVMRTIVNPEPYNTDMSAYSAIIKSDGLSLGGTATPSVDATLDTHLTITVLDA